MTLISNKHVSKKGFAELLGRRPQETLENEERKGSNVGGFYSRIGGYQNRT